MSKDYALSLLKKERDKLIKEVELNTEKPYAQEIARRKLESVLEGLKRF